MCGIWLWISQHGTFPNPEKGVKGIEARGPEGTRILQTSTGCFVFSRLAINGLQPEGMQPFEKGQFTWMCNGEIYNAHQLGLVMPSGSD